MVRALGTWIVNEDRRIGKGGFSKVYWCKREDSRDYQGAMKVFDKGTAVNTYQKEVSALEVLASAPHTPGMLDHGRDSSGRLSIVTELITGCSLNVHLRENGPLSPDRTLSLLRSVLSLLHDAHAAGLVHMDIQAPNVMIGDNGDFNLIDWGTSEELATDRIETISANKDVVAPECFHGHFSAATDFYSLAWLVIYALSGKLPYHCHAIEDKAYRTLAHCLEKPLLPASIPESLKPLLYNWLNKDPEARCLVYDLDAALETVSGDADAFMTYRSVRQLQHEFSYRHYAARQDIPYAQYHYARELLDEDRTDEAIYWLERAYQLGYARAAYLLAMTLEHRDSDEPQKIRIRDMLEFAAQGQITRAQYELARRLTDGNYAADYSDDPTRASGLLRASADSGYRRAQHALALHLMQSGDEAGEAHKYMNMAAERGLREARHYLGQAIPGGRL